MIKQTIFDFWDFIKRPTDTQSDKNGKEKLKIIFILLGLNILFSFIIFTPLDYIVEYFITTRNKINYQETDYLCLFLAP